MAASLINVKSNSSPACRYRGRVSLIVRITIKRISCLILSNYDGLQFM